MTWQCHIFAVLALAFSACFHQGLASDISMTEPVVPQICDTRQCVLSAANLINNMKETADPCEDFSEFACGRFIEESEIPPGRYYVATHSGLDDQNTLFLRNILLEASSPSDPKYLRKMRQFYQSCMDEAQIEVVGLEPYFKDKTFIDDWPTLNPSWTEANFNLNEVIGRYMAAGVEPIFAIDVSNDLNDSTVNVIQLTEGDLDDMSQEDLIKERNDSKVMAYEKYLAETAIALNASREVAEEDARDVVDLMIELATIMLPSSDRSDHSKQLNPVSLKDLDTVSDTLDIARVLRTTFDTANITLADNERIINLYPTYMGNISSVLERFSNRTIQNLFGFRYAVSRVAGITQRLLDIRLELIKQLLESENTPRTEMCWRRTNRAFSKGLGRQYVLTKLPQTAKLYLNTMIDNLMKEFHLIIEEATWMSNQTKVGAFAKLASMRREIGYPDEGFEDSDVERYYENYTVNEKEFYNNEVVVIMQDQLRHLKKLRQPASKNEWPAAPHELNAGYDVNRNAIFFLAGILQPPLFLESYQHYLNYGFMGSVIGHEITHGFDHEGSQFDKDGNVREWWTEEDRQNFNNRAQCLIDQTFNITVVELNMTLNGNETQGESIADRGGLIESFRAYQKKIKHCGAQPTLPGLKLTQDQLFFLAYAQFFCAKYTPGALSWMVESGTHLPGNYRINLALQNSEEFAKAYNCPLGSFMNPAEKCSVW